MSNRSSQSHHRLRVWRARPHVCELCGDPLTWRRYRQNHIIPVRRWVCNEDWALLMLCANCHAEI